MFSTSRILKHLGILCAGIFSFPYAMSRAISSNNIWNFKYATYVDPLFFPLLAEMLALRIIRQKGKPCCVFLYERV